MPILSKLSPKAWIVFNPTTGAIIDSVNVSSISGTGGDVTINWDADFANDNYVVVATGQNYGTLLEIFEYSSKVAGSVHIRCFTATSSANTTKVATSPVNVSVVAFGE